MSMKYSIKKLLKEPKLVKQIFPYSPLNFQTISPHNNQYIKGFEFDSNEKTLDILDKAHKASKVLRGQDIDTQFRKMNNLVQVLTKHKEVLAQLITLEMGKAITEARIEVDRVNQTINYYVENSRHYLANKPFKDIGALKNYIVHEPLGTILNITPWNLPLAMPAKSVIPALIARNSVILKPAPNVPQTSILLRDCFYEAGFTNNEFQLSFSNTENIDKIIGDKRVNYVVFTGSTLAGRTIGELTGKNIKRSLLELGGSDPMLILDDADVNTAVTYALNARFRANGQTCTSSKRIIVHEKIYDQFVEQLKQRVETVKFGDPSADSTVVGPIARFDLFMKLNRQLDEYIKDYEYSIDKGCYLKPFIIENPKTTSIPYTEEIFGPVFCIYKRKNVEEMIETANDTEYGLSSCVITKNEQKGEEIASRLESGMCYINTPCVVNPCLPFGGYKNSGFGRANSIYIFNELTNLKTMTVNKDYLK